MKDTKLFKKWWFWVIVGIIVLGALGSFVQDNETDQATDSRPANSTQNTSKTEAKTSTLPSINADDYKNKEGLVVYKDLKAKGYGVNAEFENKALTDINGNASDLFENLDPNKPEDKASVDAFKVGDLIQSGDTVNLTIVLQSS